MNTWVCIASGPSLTREDCIIVEKSGLPVIAVNSSWEMIPGCQYVYAGDHSWWSVNFNGVPDDKCRYTSVHATATQYSINYFESPAKGSFNSGQRAILLAKSLGAKRIILLGYDCSLQNGIHWHGKHNNGLRNPDRDSLKRWKNEFRQVIPIVGAHNVINCSRHTELDMFPVGNLEEEICKSFL
ncbi:TPA: hypothetical protein RQO74_000277 [Klebsiella michiganensis]|nr:hypothetical protein [Klebsiella michiganensis]